MHYTEFAPGPALAEHVAAYWHFRLEGDEPLTHTVPLTGGALLTVAPAAGQAFLFGPRVAPLSKVVRPGDVFWGVHFRPGAHRALAGQPRLRETVTAAVPGLLRLRDVKRLRGADVAEVRRVFDAALSRALGPGVVDVPVQRAVSALVASEGRLPVSRLAPLAGLSERQLRRRFVALVELLPKELARLCRARATAVELVRAPDTWAALAPERGYADQAHLTREFRQLLGLTPGAFARHARRIAHHLR
ncbi:MAG: helix-turn-helix domain-containing protein [Myxococcota bacterium]